jgi:DNA-binding SARP family transcriptional activator/tetratricopeptide (TPR) repeat protein
VSEGLRALLLGGFRLLHNGGTTEAVQSARLQDLVTYLLLHPSVPHPRGTLAARFWPESPDGQARTNLRKLVMDLRRCLPQAECFVEITDKDLRWRGDAPCVVDALEFERLGADGASVPDLEQAAQLYRGDLVPQCYDDWVVPRREALRDRLASVLERLVAAHERRRDHGAAIRYAQRLLDHDPLLESTYRLLMRLHAVTGDRTGAVRIYHACATTLQRELGVPPSPETREAYERLLAAGARPAVQPMALPPMVGRGVEWERLQEAWRAATAGRTQIVVVRGDPGIGKSRLAEELLDWVGHQGIPSALARCYSAETDLAYAPVTALLRARPLPPLAPALKREVARLVPSLLQDDPSVSAPGPMQESWQQQHLYDALSRVLLADQPVAIVLDDVHWCDEESLAFLHYLTRHDRAARMLMLLTMRPEEVSPDHPLQRNLASWRHSGSLVEIELAPLDKQQTLEVAAAIAPGTPEPELAARLFTETEGNPLLIVELARAGLDRVGMEGATLPARAREIISARLSGLSPATRALAGVAAVVGRSFTFGLLAEVSGEEEDLLIRSLDELWQRRIIREQGVAAYDFTHERVRDVAQAQLSPTKRRWLHRQVAQALESLHAGTLDEVAGQIALHYEQAGMPERAIPFYLRAADIARRVYASDVAINCFHRLLAIERGVDRVEVMRRLGDVWQRLGRWDDAERIYRQALATAEQDGDATRRAECLIGVGFILRLQGRYDAAVAALEEARAEYERLGIASGVSGAIGHIGNVAFERADLDGALACFLQQQQIAERLSDDAGISNATRDLGLVYWLQGDYPKAIECHKRCLALAERHGDRWGIEGMNALNNLGLVYRVQGEFKRAVQCHRESLEIARQIANRRGEAVALGNLGIDHEQQGEYLRAHACFVDQLDITEAIGDRRGTSLAVGGLGNVYEAFGRPDEALRCFARQIAIVGDLGDRRGLGIGLGNVARIWAAQGRLADAESLHRRSLGIFKALKLPFYRCESQYRLAEVCYRRGEFSRAIALAEHAADCATELRRDGMLFAAELLIVRARLATGASSVEESATALRSLLGRFPEPRYQAPIYYALWRLQALPDSHANAAKLYRHLAQGSPRVEYRDRVQELSAERLEPLPDPGPLPRSVSGRDLELTEVLQRVEAL